MESDDSFVNINGNIDAGDDRFLELRGKMKIFNIC